MKTNKTTKGLYDHLFDTLEKVKNGDCDLDEAKAVVNISNAIVNVAKLEVQVMEKLGSEYDLGLIPKFGGQAWLEDKSNENIKLISAKTKNELYAEMQKFFNDNKDNSPILLDSYYDNKTDTWQAKYRLTH